MNTTEAKGQEAEPAASAGSSEARERTQTQRAAGSSEARERTRTSDASPGISVAPSAVDAIARQLAKRGTPGASLRLGLRGGGCSGFSYVIEFHDGAPHARDRIFDFTSSGGSPVRVVVDPKSLLYLSGTVLEWEQTLMRQGFKFANPNEKSGCGCGSSFSV